jgi:hypothetical protein
MLAADEVSVRAIVTPRCARVEAPIKREIELVGQKPLVKKYQDLNLKVAPETLGHAWIGWTPLYTGAFYNPKTLFPMY